MATAPLAPVTPSASADLDGQKLLRGIRRDARLIVILTCLGLFLAGVVTATQPYQYEAQSTLVSQPQTSESELKTLAAQFSALPGGQALTGNQLVFTEMEIIRSRTVLAQAVDREHLQIDVRDLSRERTLGARVIQLVSTAMGLAPAPPIEDWQGLQRPVTFATSAVPQTVHKTKWLITRTGETTFEIRDAGTKSVLGSGALEQPFEAAGIRFTISGLEFPIGQSCELKFRTREGAIKDLADTVEVRRVRDRAELMAVAWRDTSPVRSKYVVNAITQAYLDQSLAWKSELGKATDTLLAAQVEQREQELVTAQEALNAFKASSNTVNFSREGEGLLMQLSDGRLSLGTQEIETQQLGFALERLRRANDREFLVFLDGSGSAAVPAQATLVTELAELIARRDGMLTSRTAEHPNVQSVTAQIEAKKSQILTLVEEAYRTASRRQSLLASQVNELESLRKQMPETEATYTRLQADVQLAAGLLQALKQRKQTNEISQLAAAAPMRILDPAIAPLRHSSPRWAVQIALGLLVGLMLGLSVATGRAVLDTTMRNRAQAESLGLPVIAQVPRISEHWSAPKGQPAPRLWLAVRQDPLGPVAEAFRILRSAITLATPGTSGRILGITSAGIGEGKSLVTTNLAAVCAQAGLRTLVIDADLRRPSVARGFGIPQSPGLVEVLEGRTTPPEAIRESGIANLWLLPAGDRTGQPSELLQSESFTRLLQTLRREGETPLQQGPRSAPFDVILLDLPPVSAVSETLALGRQTSALYLLVRAGQTPREVAQDALVRLELAKIAVRGLILNDVSKGDLGRLAGYYYHNYTEEGEQVDRGLWERLTGQRRRRPTSPVER